MVFSYTYMFDNINKQTTKNPYDNDKQYLSVGYPSPEMGKLEAH